MGWLVGLAIGVIIWLISGGGSGPGGPGPGGGPIPNDQRHLIPQYELELQNACLNGGGTWFYVPAADEDDFPHDVLRMAYISISKWGCAVAIEASPIDVSHIPPWMFIQPPEGYRYEDDDDEGDNA